MYIDKNMSVEDCCYESEHIAKVLKEIKKNFEPYFERFIETNAGTGISAEEFEKLQKKFGAKETGKTKTKNRTSNFKDIYIYAVEDFENNRQKYFDLLDLESLEEYEDDPAAFKSKALKNECPIIHSTYYNKGARELDKYRAAFNIANANELLEVVTNLSTFAEDYMENVYDKHTYDKIDNLDDLELSDLDTDEYTVYGVIGGGIKSQLLYKIYPEAFSNRSRNATWALWFLTNKEKFGCITDSEFLMIDTKNVITQQNYFYPYELFSFYAHEIYKLIQKKAKELEVGLDDKYRYVVVDAFLDYVASEHDEEISLYKSQIRDGGVGLA